MPPGRALFHCLTVSLQELIHSKWVADGEQARRQVVSAGMQLLTRIWEADGLDVAKSMVAASGRTNTLSSAVSLGKAARLASCVLEQVTSHVLHRMEDGHTGN